MTRGPERAEAIRALAALVRSGLPLRGALQAWCDDAAPPLAGPLRHVARRAALGDSLDGALGILHQTFGEDTRALRTLVDLHVRFGGEIAPMLDGLATAIEVRHAVNEEARAAGAGARLSGRMVAFLPIAFVPLTPMARTPIFDAAGMTIMLAGLILATIGVWWIGRLVPRMPESDDGAAWIAGVVASVLRGGTGLRTALEAVSRSPPPELRAEMDMTRRLTILGASWPEALRKTEHQGLHGLAVTIERSVSFGLPAARSLDAFAANRRSERARAFEEAVRKAPVKMVVPLVLCVLPSFMLLALTPFLRGLAAPA